MEAHPIDQSLTFSRKCENPVHAQAVYIRPFRGKGLGLRLTHIMQRLCGRWDGMQNMHVIDLAVATHVR